MVPMYPSKCLGLCNNIRYNEIRRQCLFFRYSELKPLPLKGKISLQNGPLFSCGFIPVFFIHRFSKNFAVSGNTLLQLSGAEHRHCRVVAQRRTSEIL